eukprot:scaffold21593_cov93-Cylindrotheca_fusiformis.AAC.1
MVRLRFRINRIKSSSRRSHSSSQETKDDRPRYRVGGNMAIVLEMEDLHDPKNDSLEVIDTFIDLGIAEQSKVPD